MHRGPFFLSHVPGMAVNIITVAWLVFAIVFFSFPYYMPVTSKFNKFNPAEKKMGEADS
jgi:choline transport protein